MIWEQMWLFFTDPASWAGPSGIPARASEHLWYTLVVVTFAFLIAFPLGSVIGHYGKGSWFVINVANGARSLPTLGLLTLLVLVLGLGFAPAAIGLTILAVPPILTATYAGIRGADDQVVDAARGMGMPEWKILTNIEIPLGFQVILGGLRSATLQVIATATVAAYIALGGLGRFILDGLALRNYGKMAGGAVLVATLALLTDLLFAAISRLTSDRDGELRNATRRRRRRSATAEATPEANPVEQEGRRAFAGELAVASAEANPALSLDKPGGDRGG